MFSRFSSSPSKTYALGTDLDFISLEVLFFTYKKKKVKASVTESVSRIICIGRELTKRTAYSHQNLKCLIAVL